MPYSFGIKMIFVLTQILYELNRRLRKQFMFYPPPRFTSNSLFINSLYISLFVIIILPI